MTTIENEWKNITEDPISIQGIIRKYYEKFMPIKATS